MSIDQTKISVLLLGKQDIVSFLTMRDAVFGIMKGDRFREKRQ